jgi:hypothetical protein
MAVMSSDRLEGVADAGPYGAQWQVRRRPAPARSTALGLLPQRPAWVRTGGGGSHTINSGRDGVPPAYRLHLTLQGHKKADRGCGRPPSEGSARQPYQSRRRGVTGLALATPHSPPPQWWGWAPSWGVGAAAPGREPQAHDGAAPLMSGH